MGRPPDSIATLLATLAAAMQIGMVSAQPAQRTPAFRAGTELVTIDLQIAATHGVPIRDFTPADFAVEVGGRKRTQLSATRLHFDEGAVVRDGRPG